MLAIIVYYFIRRECMFRFYLYLITICRYSKVTIYLYFSGVLYLLSPLCILITLFLLHSYTRLLTTLSYTRYISRLSAYGLKPLAREGMTTKSTTKNSSSLGTLRCSWHWKRCQGRKLRSVASFFVRHLHKTNNGDSDA